MKKRAMVVTLGCKLNQVDGEAIRESFERAGYEIASFGEEADAYIINTCSVTGETDRQSRQLLRRVMKMRELNRAARPGAVVVATGCYTQTEPEHLAKFAPGIDLLVGNPDKERIPELIAELFGENTAAAAPAKPESFIADAVAEKTFRLSRITDFAGHNRAFLRVQDGCNHRCAYCIVPYARGPERSAPLEDAVAQAEVFATRGFPEIVITGVHVGRYGAGEQGASLASLLLKLNDIDALSRIRVSSMDPGEFSEELFCALDSVRSKICPHFHISLQSCDDSVLRAMRRDYKFSQCRDIVGRLRGLFPDAAIGADIIAGFPGETDVNFETTYRAIEELELSYMHVFRYSKRRGTPAAEMSGQIPPEAKKARSRRLLDLRDALNESFRSRFIGRKMEVLFETRRDRKSGLLTGLTRNYIRVFADGPDSFQGRLAVAKLDRLNQSGVTGIDLKEYIITNQP
ncbi:MAG: tRNA (N(6)-L-threonylcarbamoyladenosine(37)-C(2))-methylthiotransferase MtaB [bacterium]